MCSDGIAHRWSDQGCPELDCLCLWITFADCKLWWAFAEGEVLPSHEASEDRPLRYRRTIGGWRHESLSGESFAMSSLSTALTCTAGYRGTICGGDRKDYLLRRIRGEEEPLVVAARAVREKLETVAADMIALLDWRAFEIMVDLIFARGGWQRQSAVGDGEVDIDLLLYHPATGERAWVQVKSTADQKVLAGYLGRYRRDGGAERFYFICHSPKGTLALADEPRAHVWTGRELARATVAAGLFDWLVDRTR